MLEYAVNRKNTTWQVGQIVLGILDIIFPPACAVCKKGGSVLCSSCLSTIPLLQPPFCPHCSSTKLEQGICRSCYYRPLQLNGLRAASTYQGTLRACIHALKYEGNTRIAEALATLLCHTFISHNMQADLLIPMPLHKERIRERGYNQSQLLAELCAWRLGIPISTDVVIRHRVTEAQVGLTANERQHNVAGAFSCAPPFATNTIVGRKIVLIDDVCTTGATLEACAHPLFAAGASSVWGLVLARPL